MSLSNVQFSILDYSFFVIVFFVSILIGLYFARKSKKDGKNTVDEYFFGGKKMEVIPVAFSLVATSVTGSSTIGLSMEVYAYGLHTWMYIVIIPIWGLVMHYIFLRIFYDLQLDSSFTYLEMRFDKSVKQFASALYVISGFFVMPLMIYTPALCFQEVTGINLYVTAIVTGLLCVLYTVIGGIKAVVWTDLFQCVLIFGSSIVILVVGLNSVGGLYKVWEALERGGRSTTLKTEFDFEIRGSTWAYLFSTIFIIIYQCGMSQSSVQRFSSLPTYTKALQALWFQVFLFMLALMLEILIGAIIYANYEDCDPLSAGFVRKLDQVFAHFVQGKASVFNGFTGVFVAGVFAAGLSTMSSILNTVSGTIYVDFLSKSMVNYSEKTINRTVKIIVTIVGVVTIALIFLIEHLGTIFAISLKCLTVSTVGIFGLFINGMLFPRINSKGAKCGVAVSMLVVGILILGGINKSPDPMLPLRIDNCDIANITSNASNSTLYEKIANEVNPNKDIPWIFRVNFQFHCIIGLIVSITVGYIISGLTGWNEVRDERLLVSFLRKNIPKDVLLTNKQ
ncbi:hypothetical protein DMENIID0001_086950 [Sergentomyia squamirostris]